jgi:regulator of nucleoside diphosphate kinase
MKVQHVFTDANRWRLGRLILSHQARSLATKQLLDELEWELEESEAVNSECIPDDVVTMNSTVRLVCMKSTEELTCTVVYPDDVELVDDGVSVLEPMGSLLIGCEVGDLLECNELVAPGPWRVAEIVFQPERVSALPL